MYLITEYPKRRFPEQVGLSCSVSDTGWISGFGYIPGPGLHLLLVLAWATCTVNFHLQDSWLC